MVTVSSRSWMATKLPVSEGALIDGDQMLVKIDDRESRHIKQLQAQKAAIAAQRARLVSERKLVDSQTKTRVNTQLAAVNVAAPRFLLETSVGKRQAQLEQDKALFGKKVIARRQFDQTRTTMQRIDGEYRTRVAELEEARNKLREARADRQRLSVLDSEINILVHEEDELQAQLERQRLDLKDRTIGSPVQGVVDRVFVEEGEYVTPGAAPAIGPRPEEGLDRREREGNRYSEGEDRSDGRCYRGCLSRQEIRGKVIAIGNAATSEFALLPTPNPSGNFTKITQRLRVRVAIDQEQNPSARHDGRSLH